jgi:hypothetical protein
VTPLTLYPRQFRPFQLLQLRDFTLYRPVQTIQPLTIPQVFGIHLALVASTLAMSDFANSVIGGLAFSAACGGLIIGASLIVLAFVPPRKKANR